MRYTTRTTLGCLALLAGLAAAGESAEHGTLRDARDGQSYRWVRIGAQVWMAQNLNYRTKDSWCYDNKPANCAAYGRLYDWAGAMGIAAAYNRMSWSSDAAEHRGVCPQGWHLPTDAEWSRLTETLGATRTGRERLAALMAKTSWKQGHGSDAVGFAAKAAGGYYKADGDARYPKHFGDLGTAAEFWTSSQGRDADFAYLREIDPTRPDVNNPRTKIPDDEDAYYSKSYAYSVRCLQDGAAVLPRRVVRRPESVETGSLDEPIVPPNVLASPPSEDAQEEGESGAAPGELP